MNEGESHAQESSLTEAQELLWNESYGKIVRVELLENDYDRAYGNVAMKRFDRGDAYWEAKKKLTDKGLDLDQAQAQMIDKLLEAFRARFDTKFDSQEAKKNALTMGDYHQAYAKAQKQYSDAISAYYDLVINKSSGSTPNAERPSEQQRLTATTSLHEAYRKMNVASAEFFGYVYLNKIPNAMSAPEFPHDAGLKAAGHIVALFGADFLKDKLLSFTTQSQKVLAFANL